VGKRKVFQKEEAQIDKLRQENRKLKHQISQLRKQLDRIDVDRYQNLKQIVEKQAKEDAEAESTVHHERSMRDWKCRECTDGVLRISIIQRLDGVFYYRSCTHCPNRTKLQKYTEDVKGD
jgi:hypothetical protein